MKSVLENPILKLEGVSHSYSRKSPNIEERSRRVLDCIFLDLYDGETLGVIGNNGCGKTTILRIMAGILAPTCGRVTRRKGASAALLSIGLGFKPNASGRSNAKLAAMLQGSSKKEAESYLEEIKEFSELGSAFEEPVRSYSSGMMSRLGFTTALKTHVDILLIDEVLSVGDAHFRQKAEKAIEDRISGEQTVVFVSHSATQIQHLCSRAIWLYDGKIASQGETALVLEEYSEHVERSATD